MPDPEDAPMPNTANLKEHSSRTAIVNLVVPLLPTTPRSQSQRHAAAEPPHERGDEAEWPSPNSPAVSVKKEEESEDDGVPEVDPFGEDHCSPPGASQERCLPEEPTSEAVPAVPGGSRRRGRPRKSNPASASRPSLPGGDDQDQEGDANLAKQPATKNKDGTRKIRFSSSSSEAKCGMMELTTSKDATTGMYKCPLCPRIFRMAKCIPGHYEADHMNIRFQCTKCEKEFTRQSAYYRHYKQVHIGVKKFKCSSCNRRFPRRKNLELHNPQRCRERMEQPTPSPASPSKAPRARPPAPPGIYGCRRCDQVFKSLEERRQHVKEVHPTSTAGPAVCEICGKQVASRVRLWRHKTTVHAEVRKYHCDLCGAEFKRQDNLVDHRNAVHLGIRKPRAPRQRKKSVSATSIGAPESEGVSLDQV